MDNLELYATALDNFKSRTFDAASNLVDELKKSAPAWKKPFLLEAYILRERLFDEEFFT